MLNETVNYSNGSVSFDISFPVPSGRGISVPYIWNYNSGSVNTLNSVDGATPVWNYGPAYNTQGWNLNKGIPQASVQVFSLTPPTGPPGMTLAPCNYQSGMTFTDSSGVQHNLNTAAFAAEYIGQGYLSTCGTAQVVLPPGGDGQVAATIWPQTASNDLYSGNPYSGPFIVEDKNGTIYTFAQSATSPGNVNGPVSSMEDKNGNVISFPGANGAVYTDTLGRPGPVLSGNNITIGNQQFTANWGTSSSNYTVAYQGGVPSSSPILCHGFPANVTGTHPALQTLTLPNAKEFQFFYGSYGLLTEIIYPDGGWVKYTWQLSSTKNEEASMGGFTQQMGSNGFYYNPVSYGCNWAYQTPVLATRTVSFDGTNVAQTQQFTFNTTWSYNSDGTINGWTQKTATVTTTDNVRNLSSKVVYTYVPLGVPSQPYQTSGIATMIPVESTIQYYDWGKSTMSRQVAKTWYDQFNLSSETTTIYGTSTLTSKTAYTYTNGLPCSGLSVASFVYLQEKDDYDFGQGTSAGPLKKKTIYNYHCFPPAHVYGSYDSAPWTNYTGVLLAPQVSSITIEDGSGAIKAATQYNYDETAPSPSYAVPTQYDTSYNNVTIRGNVTSEIKCTTLPSTPTASCSGPTTRYAYDYAGQRVSVTDPKLNRTTYSYNDNFTDTSSAPTTDAFVTNIVEANGLQRTFGYSYWLGYLTQSTDLNPNNTTTYTYGSTPAGCGNADTLDRLTEIDYPDGGKTTNCYNDGAASVTTSKLLDSTTNTTETTVAYRDGLFHTIKTQVTSDPDGATAVDMAYDGEGKLYTWSNPHRGSGSTTDGTTTYYYDALGRTIETSEQDGSLIQMCYDGVPSTPSVWCSSSQIGTSGAIATRVDTTDEAGSHWQRATDALGRLIQVIEPNGATQTPTMETDYGYDLLNNLLSVNQWGGAYNCCTSTERVRTFTYDNIGRLLTAQNPETGTITYKYLTDSFGYCAGDQSLPCKKTDARNISISYAYDSVNRLSTKTYSNSEPTVRYTYDAYATGSYGSGNYGKGHRTGMTDASGSTSWTYDKMAREWTENRAIGTVQKLVGAEYNEGGSVKYQHYPSGASLHYLVGGAGRDLSVHDDTNNMQYALCASYAPPGEQATATFGYSSCSGGGIQDTRQYNSRLQPSSILVTAGSTTDMNLNYDFHLGANDNGNLYTLSNYKDSTRSQTFTYDTLNRILTAQTPTGSHAWGISFTNSSGGQGIDAFGNLTQTSQISSKPLAMSVNQQVNTANQFTLLGYGYDAAGNVLSDGLSSGCSGYGYSWNAEEMQSCANGITYAYNGDDARVKKSSGTLYWGGEAGDALAESDLSGNLTSEYVFFGGKRIAKRDIVSTIDIRFTNDSCSGCGGNPTGGGDRNLYVTSITIGSTTIPVTDPSVSFNQNGCSSISNGVLAVNCNGDVYVTTSSSSPNIVVNAYGSTDYNIYPHMQVYLNSGLAGEWNVNGSTQGYTANPIYFYLTDHLGSSTVIANSLGETLDESDFYPFGGELSISNSLPSHYKYTGKERDAETGNDYFGARFYANIVGRFMSPDWSVKVEPVPYAKLDDPQSLNLYAYVRNNPLGGVDQDGHCSGDDCGKVTVTATTSGDAPITSSNGGRTATAEGTVQYKFTYKEKPLENAPIHEDISNKSSRDGVAEKANLTTSDSATGPANGFPPGTVSDTSNISITIPFGGAESTMETSVFSKETTQTLSFQTPTGSSCSVTETRTLSNADSKGQPTDTYKIKLTSPTTQQATPKPPPPPPKTPTK